MVERTLAAVGLAGAILVALALTGALQHPAGPGTRAALPRVAPRADVLSAVVSPPVSMTRSRDRGSRTTTGICTELAGNATSNTGRDINIDKTATPPSGGPPNDNIANAAVVSGL